MKATERKPKEQSRVKQRNDTAERRARILYAASTESHLNRFHLPYIHALQERCDVECMANGDGVEYSIAFEKSIFSFSNFKAMRKIRRILKEQAFDALILNTSLAAFLIRMAMIGLKKRPYVLNIVHGYLFFEPPQGKKDRLMLLCEKINRRRTDEIAVMNLEDAEIVKKYRLCKGNTHFIKGMGIRVPDAQPMVDEALRAQFAPQEKDVLLTFVGELSVRKNQSFLIRAVKRLREEGLSVRLMLVGEGSEREALEKQIEELKLSEAVFLVGSQSNVIPYLSITDVYVSASRSEGLPFNLMEAMSVGLPIVASNVKGQYDLFRSMPACLYQANDMEAFCEAIRTACKGERGVGAASYPQLKDYALETVFEGNLQMMKGFFE